MTDVDPVVSIARTLASRETQLPRIRAAGEQALHRLLPIANVDDAQGEVVRALLLGCYNGGEFPFDLTSIRVLDRAVLDDSLAVLHMDSSPAMEVHQYIPNGDVIFNALAKHWRRPGGLSVEIPRREGAESEVLRTLGRKSLRHLIQVANGFSGQCRYVARFLAGCYDGVRYPFDLTDLRCLDPELFLDCIATMRLLYESREAVQTNVAGGDEVFRRLISDWSIEEYASASIRS
ncbi:TPA: hypothetical protein ACP32N_003294 [Pseudomonas aeruginosa]